MVLIMLWVALSGCATTPSGTDTRTERQSPTSLTSIDQLRTRISELEQDQRQLQESIHLLEQSLDALHAEKAQWQWETERLNAVITRMQLRIDHLTSSSVDGSGDPAGALAALKKEQGRTLELRSESLARVAALSAQVEQQQHEMQEASRQQQQQQEQYETQIRAMRDELEFLSESARVASDVVVGADGNTSSATDEALYVQADAADADAEAPKPVIKTLFYGTNRQRSSHARTDYLTPFLIPLVLLGLLLAVPRAVRAVIRTYLQRVAINLFRVVLGVALIYFTSSALYTAVQRWQDNHALLVQYGPERMQGLINGFGFELGICQVSIPPLHEPGVVEQPRMLYFEYRSDPAEHFVLSSIEPLADKAFFEALQDRVRLSPARDLFVFVHGFHNTFKDAAFRTAQIAHDLGFPGAPVFYSWPSQGTVQGYTTDENNVLEAERHLQDFLHQIKTRSGAERIHVIAHSMGSRALTAVVRAMGANPDYTQPVFNEMVLAAPDMDAGVFRNMVPELTAATDRVTLYASSKDEALTASRQVHGGVHPRAGESYVRPVTRAPVDSIDVSVVTSGHSYISNSGKILDDLASILIDRRPLTESIAEKVLKMGEDPYWILREEPLPEPH